MKTGTELFLMLYESMTAKAQLLYYANLDEMPEEHILEILNRPIYQNAYVRLSDDKVHAKNVIERRIVIEDGDGK